MKLILVGSAILGAAVLIFAATLVASNRALDDDAAAASTASGHDMSGTSGGSGVTTAKGTSYAGAAPDNAKELAKAHKPYPAALPPTTPGDVLKVHMVLKDVTIEIAPGDQVPGLGLRGRRTRARSCTHARDRPSR